VLSVSFRAACAPRRGATDRRVRQPRAGRTTPRRAGRSHGRFAVDATPL